MAVIGYARISTDTQSLDGQIDVLKAAGADKVFSEAVSGTSTCRKQLEEAIAALGPGDTLLVTRLDRLSRTTLDMLTLLDTILAKQATLKSLAEPAADPATAHGKMTITMSAALAEFERSLIIARTSEGRERAMANGTRFGRKPKLTPHQRAEVFKMAANGTPQIDIARMFNMHPSTICGMLKAAEAERALQIAAE